MLLRHGRTSWNAVGRAQGHADVELDASGHAQAAEVAPFLARLSPNHLWCSDLVRARQTCEYLERATGLAPVYDPRLREFDVGARQGLTMAEFAEAFPAEHAAWVRGDTSLRVPGAEVTADVAARIVPVLLEVLTAVVPGGTAVVVTHGAALRVGLAGLLGWPDGLTSTLGAVDNCAWATLEERFPGEAPRLVGYNERVRPFPGADFASLPAVG